jgi:hypothetical protein
MNGEDRMWEAIAEAVLAGFAVLPRDGMDVPAVREGRVIAFDVDHGQKKVASEMAEILRTCTKST